MHNRNFVINMVINGEKSPAFSARTLELPPPQTDNTGRIIENTRRSYSKSRTEVEEAISAVIQPPQQFQPKKPPVSQTLAKQWPVNAQTQTVTPQSQQPKPPAATQQGSGAAQTAPTAPQEAIGSGEAPAKRKRTRRRKKPATAGVAGEQPTAAPAPSQQPANNDHELRLR